MTSSENIFFHSLRELWRVGKIGLSMWLVSLLLVAVGLISWFVPVVSMAVMVAFSLFLQIQFRKIETEKPH
jgi:hypothetical protein